MLLGVISGQLASVPSPPEGPHVGSIDTSRQENTGPWTFDLAANAGWTGLAEWAITTGTPPPGTTLDSSGVVTIPNVANSADFTFGGTLTDPIGFADWTIDLHVTEPLVLAGVYAQDAQAMGPIRYYRLGDAPGATVMAGSSGSGQPGAYVGNVLLGQAALVDLAGGDKALRLDTAADYAFAPPINAAALMFSCAVQITNAAGQHTIAEADGGQPNDGWTCEVINNKVRAGIRSAAGGGTTQWILGSTTGFPTSGPGIVNEQRHVVKWYFGPGGAEIWLDGLRIAHEPGLTDAVLANTANLVIGSYHGANSLAGFIDEFLVFNRHLTSGEIANLARLPVVAPPVPVATNDTFGTVTEDTGNRDIDVLFNDTFSGTPSISITTQTSGLGATVQPGLGPNGRPIIRVPTSGSTGAKSITYQLTATGNTGNDTANLTGTIQAVSTGAYCTFYTGTAQKYPPAMPTRPALRVPFIDPDNNFPSRVIRITGNAGTNDGVGGTWRTEARRHHYSKSPVWNANGTVMILTGASGHTLPPYFLDGITYVPIRRGNGPPGGTHARWHPTNPNVMLSITKNVNPGRVGLWSWANNSFDDDPITGYRNFGFGTEPGGGMEANFDLAGRYCVVIAQRNSDDAWCAFVYDLVAGSKGSDFAVGVLDDFNNAHWNVSCSGDYVVRHTDYNCSVRSRTSPNTVISNSGAPGGLTTRNHQSSCQAANGDDYQTWCTSSGSMVRMGPFRPSGTYPQVTLYNASANNNAGVNHTAGWAGQGKVLGGMDQGTATRVRNDEAVLFDLLSGNIIGRLAQHRGTRGPNNAYVSEHHPSMTWDYERYVFASNWDLTPSALTVDAYVVESCTYEGTFYA